MPTVFLDFELGTQGGNVVDLYPTLHSASVINQPSPPNPQSAGWSPLASHDEKFSVSNGVMTAWIYGHNLNTYQPRRFWTFDTGYEGVSEVRTFWQSGNIEFAKGGLILRAPPDMITPLPSVPHGPTNQACFVAEFRTVAGVKPNPDINYMHVHWQNDLGELQENFPALPAAGPDISHLALGQTYWQAMKFRVTNLEELAPDGDPKVRAEAAVWLDGNPEPSYDDWASNPGVIRHDFAGTGRPLVDKTGGLMMMGHVSEPGKVWIGYRSLSLEGWSSQVGVKADVEAKAAVSGDVNASPAVSADVAASAAVSGDASLGEAVSGDIVSSPAVTGDVNMIRRHAR